MFRLNQKQWKLSVILFSSHAVSPGGESLAVPKLLETYLCIHTQIYHMCVTAKRKERRKAEEKSRKLTASSKIFILRPYAVPPDEWL